MRHGSSVAGVADPGRGAERLSERFFGRGRMWRSGFGEVVLSDVARRPSVKTGATVPGYSGGLAAYASVGFFFVAGFADPGCGAERLSERLFGSGPDAKKRFRVRVLRDVA